MSREFRWVGAQYFHAALLDAAEPEHPPRHPVSQVLSRLYDALSHLEYDCASYEAHDSGPDRVVLGLQTAWPAIDAAIKDLAKIHRDDQSLIAGLLRDMNLKP